MEVWGDLSRSLTYDVGETILLRDGDGKLIDYADTRFTRRVRTEIARTNEVLAGIKIEVPCEWRGHHMLIDESYVLPVPGNPLRRIYGRGSFSMGGRAYGWWQNIPKGARAQMTINGESVAEADYSAMHATMLYNRVGIRFVGDPYDIDGYERSEVKHGFNIAINAKNRWAAIGALAREIGKSKKYCAELLKAILHKHKAIERYFCSDVGMKLMNADSQLILSALRAVNRAGEIALPVHDALVIPARIADFAAGKMVESFEQVFGVVSPCYVKVKP
jgi:hypothetical protein